MEQTRCARFQAGTQHGSVDWNAVIRSGPIGEHDTEGERFHEGCA